MVSSKLRLKVCSPVFPSYIALRASYFVADGDGVDEAFQSLARLIYDRVGIRARNVVGTSNCPNIKLEDVKGKKKRKCC